MSMYNIIATAEYHYVLRLNNVHSNLEQVSEFGSFETIQNARSWYNDQVTEPYYEESQDTCNGETKQYYKTFRKGTELEWYNPLLEWYNPLHLVD